VANQITALAGISNQALASGELPKRIKIFNWGANPSDKGVFQVNALSAAALNNQIANKAYERIVIDFEHNSLLGAPKYQPPPRKHAGYGTLEVLPGEGVYLSAIEWTPTGKEFAKEYSDLSPAAMHPSATDLTVTGILSCALIPNGSLHNVTFFSAELPQGALSANQQTKETAMADITALEASVTKLTSENQTLRTELTALSGKLPDAAKITALESKASTLESTVTALSAKIAGLETANVQCAKDALLAGAQQSGKVVALAADVIGLMTTKQLEDYITALQVTVPVSRRTPVVTALGAKTGDDLVAQYNAIQDPKERAAFFKKNRAALGGK
jgi:hypothetical protein